ncbi:MAG: saccharopine dehydrogenase NADP-binding domain-containing protein [Acidobacteria bacterium]|nr:saccharopine dehydrogenase NADP-binding domain-containing protein [Acidobacteriota bacterium]
MKKILILGAGKIGSLISCLLSHSGDYTVHLGDSDSEVIGRVASELAQPNLHPVTINAIEEGELARFVAETGPDAIVSALPYYCNILVAEVARDYGVHYFDLTEDVEVTRAVRRLSEGRPTCFVPQCGLAPGFISIVANELMTHFDDLDTVKLRVGALPVNPSNVLKYSLTWSTDGLINEYANPCYGIENGKMTVLLPLEGHETIEVDGLLYEAFNTSGGLGTLADTYDGRVRTMNYKTLRYPGHCEKIHFLMQDLKLGQDRPTLKRILENAIPQTLQDVVLIYVSVMGRQKGQLFEENYVKKVYPQRIGGHLWSAIQITTACGLCAVLDMVMQDPTTHRGFVTQESFSLPRFIENRFGQYYR